MTDPDDMRRATKRALLMLGDALEDNDPAIRMHAAEMILDHAAKLTIARIGASASANGATTMERADLSNLDAWR